MKLKLSLGQIASITVIAASFIVAIFIYPSMPEQVASHWGPTGEVDGYMSRFWGTFFMPILSAGMYLLFLIIPKIDPKKDMIKTFKKEFHTFIPAIFAFFFYIYILTLVWNSGVEFNMIQWLAPAMGMLFYECGVLIEKSKQNYTIGIKTPWTLASENVWNKTHKLGAKLFKGTAILSLLGIVFPDFAIWLILVPVLLSTIITFAYSYVEYKKEKK